MKLEEENVPEAILTQENQKNAPWNSFRDGLFAVEPKQPERKRSSYKGKYARTGKFLNLFVHKKNTTTCMFRHNVPQNNPINERVLCLGPRLSLFSKVSY